jgi:hypothetical protein
MSPGTEVNVLWPVNILNANDLVIRLSNEKQNISFIRKWKGTCDTLDWSYTGSSLEVVLTSNEVHIVPEVSVDCDKKLPYNPHVCVPLREIFIDEHDRSKYEKALFYKTDPANPENRQSNTQQVSVRPVAMPVAMPVARPVAPPPSAPSNEEVTIRTALPQHITNIVLANSISKNESCPISCDPITMENGYVTSCGHVFTNEAIHDWLRMASSRGECPVCKQKCL